MTKKAKTAVERLHSLEQQKQVLIKKRQQELLDIIVKHNALIIDDHLFTGFLLFATDPINKDNPTLLQFKELATSRKFPSKTTSSNQKSTVKDT